jgi:hypothetical protein
MAARPSAGSAAAEAMAGRIDRVGNITVPASQERAEIEAGHPARRRLRVVDCAVRAALT